MTSLLGSKFDIHTGKRLDGSQLVLRSGEGDGEQ